MKVKWWAVLSVLPVLLVLGGCTAAEKPKATPSAAPVVAQEEVVPAGYFRKPKDGEACKKVDLAPLQAVLPGIAVGAASGVYQNARYRNHLRCDFEVSTPSLVSVTIRAIFNDSAEQTAKDLDSTRNLNLDLRTITLPASKAEALVGGGGLGVYEQNMMLTGGAFATDNAMLTERLYEAIQQTSDLLLVILRKEYQATTGPSPTAASRQERRVVSPNAVAGRHEAYYEHQYDDLRAVLQIDFDRLDPSPAVAAVYGTSKAGNMMIFVATLAVLKTEAGIDGTLTRLRIT